MALPERKDMVVYKDTVDMEKEMEIKMSIQDALDTLNPMQREAAVHTEGPLLILAGAGSGKTRVLTHRIAYLMEEKGVNPWNILAITFTNKAASEMRERVNKIAGMGAESVWVSTFHSACVRILRRHIEVLGFSSNFTIYDTDDQKTVMREIFRKFSINTKIYKEVEHNTTDINEARELFHRILEDLPTYKIKEQEFHTILIKKHRKQP